MNNGISASGTNPLFFQRAANNQTYDWYDAVLKSGMSQNNYLSVSGRSDSGLSYNLGLGLQKETGNVDQEGIDKYTFKAGLNHKINDKIRFVKLVTTSIFLNFVDRWKIEVIASVL